MGGLEPLDSYPQACDTCGDSFEVRISNTESHVRCPNCGANVLIQLFREWLLEAQAMYRKAIKLAPDNLIFQQAFAGVEKRLAETSE